MNPTEPELWRRCPPSPPAPYPTWRWSRSWRSTGICSRTAWWGRGYRTPHTTRAARVDPAHIPRWTLKKKKKLLFYLKKIYVLLFRLKTFIWIFWISPLNPVSFQDSTILPSSFISMLFNILIWNPSFINPCKPVVYCYFPLLNHFASFSVNLTILSNFYL